MDFIEVEIVNWHKYNKRKDYKKMSWFALSNTFITDQEFYDFSAEEKLAWIVILSEASKAQTEKLKINLNYVDRVCGIKQKSFLSAVSKLKHLGCLKPVQDLYGICTESERHTTEQNTTLQNNNTNAQSFDFASVYKIFPRKVGKEAGFKILKRSIKTQSEFDDLLKAVARYRAHVERERIEPRYIKHFSTFANHWRDWLDEDAGTSDVKRSEGPDLSHLKWEE